MNKDHLEAVLASHKQWLDVEGGQKADLRGANLRGAKGFFLLPVQDPRGYAFTHATNCDGVWRIRVCCRDFTLEEARAHWGDRYKGERGIGDIYLYACDWLEKRIAEGKA